MPSKSSRTAARAGSSRSGSSTWATSGGTVISADANGAGGPPGGILALVAIGGIAGFFSALFGVGGGVVIVPLLIAWLAFDAKVATATSLASILITAAAGALTHGGLGNVDVPLALLIGIPAIAGVWLGNLVKRRVSTRTLTLGFSVLLVVVAAGMVVTA